MKGEAFRKLKRGDLVKHKHDRRTFVVTSNYGGRVTAVSSVDMTNPSEWDLVNADGSVIDEAQS